MDPATIKIAAWIAVALLGVGFVVAIRKYLAGVSELSDAQDVEESRFADEAIAEAHRSKIEAAEWRGDAPPTEIPPPPVPPTRAAAEEPSIAPPMPTSPPLPNQSPLDAAVHRLRALRIIEDREGELPLGIPPNGVLYRMRRGGTMAILPRVESEASLEHFVKRFDMVVCIAAGGTLIVMERLDSRAVELVDAPGAF